MVLFYDKVWEDRLFNGSGLIIDTIQLIKRQVKIDKTDSVLTISKSSEVSLELAAFLVPFVVALLCSISGILSFKNYLDYEAGRSCFGIFLLISFLPLILALKLSLKYYSSAKYIFDKGNNKFIIIKSCLNPFKKGINKYPLDWIKHIYYSNDKVMLLMDKQEAKILTINDIKVVENIIKEVDEFLKLSEKDFDISKLRPDIRDSIEINRLEKQVRSGKRDDQLYYRLGDLYFSKRQLDKAEYNYEKAIDINNSNPGYYEKLGLVITKQGKYYVALDVYKEGLSRFPGHFEFYKNTGFIYHLFIRDLSKAEYYYEKALNIAINEEKAMVDQPVVPMDKRYFILDRLAGIYEHNKNYNKAIKCYNQLIEIDDGKYGPYFNLGKIYYSQKNYKQAEKYFDKVSEFNVQDSQVQIKLAVFYFEAGQEEKAFKYLKQAVKESIEVEDRDVYNEYEQNSVAKKLFKRALEKDPEAKIYLARYRNLIK